MATEGHLPTTQACRAAVVAGLFLLALGWTVAGAQTTDQISTAVEQRSSVAAPVDGRASKVLWSGEDYTVAASARYVPGEVEVHAIDADIFFAQEGRAEVLLGGVVQGGRETAPNERRGGAIEGGHKRTLGPGDSLWVPAGLPHQVIPLDGKPFRYNYVKVRPGAKGMAAPATGPASAISSAAKPLLTTAFLEGPAVAANGDLYFTDLQGNHIWKRTLAGEVSIFRGSSNYANGLAFDNEGRLLAAENGDPAAGTEARITRTDLSTGRVEVLTSAYDGKAYVSPNDIVVDGQGRIFFTDWARPDVLPPAAPVTRNPFGVYRIDKDGKVHRLLSAPQVQAPNGVMVSPDDATLYLVESNRQPGGLRRILAYPLNADGALGAGRLFHDFSPGRSGDGMAIAANGDLWVAAGLNAPRAGGETMDTKAGVYVFDSAGRQRQMIPIGEDLLTNVAFGGPDRRTVYITAGKTVYTLTSESAGTRR